MGVVNRAWQHFEAERAIHMHVNGKTYTEIARHFKVSRGSIAGLFWRKRMRNKWNDDEINFLLRQYALGLTYAELAEVCSNQFGRPILLADAAYCVKKHGTPSRQRAKRPVSLAIIAGGVRGQ